MKFKINNFLKLEVIVIRETFINHNLNSPMHEIFIKSYFEKQCTANSTYAIFYYCVTYKYQI